MEKPNFLDTDSSILEKNLKFIKNEVEDELDQIFGSGGDQKPEVSAPPRDYKVVTPKPGATYYYNKEILDFEEIPPSFDEEFRFPESLTECLLDAIRERPTLWNIEDANYRNRDIRKVLWLEVLNQLELTEEYLSGIRKKWDRLKTAYARSKQTSYNNCGRRYKYSDYLSFLDNVNKPQLKRPPPNYTIDCDTSSASSSDFLVKNQSSKRSFCIKTFKLNTNEKYFINVCQTGEIPPPDDITEEELTNILQSDKPSSFRIPMSISEPRITKDKSNKPCDVCDIAVNPKFFAKIEKSLLFRDFFLALIAEALSDKYNIQVKVDKCIILNNRKFIGTLVAHRVRNNDVKTVLDTYKNPSQTDKDTLAKLKVNTGAKNLVQELSENEINLLKQQSEKLKEEQTAKIKEEISLAASTVPEFKLRAKVKGQNVDEIQAELYMPKCISSEEISLDIGEDRIVVESMKHGYLFDKFVNYKLDQDRVNAIFDKTNKMLQVRVSVATVN